jgi:hypothetical protein
MARNSKEEILENKTLAQVEKGDSQFWFGLMDVKSKFFEKGRFMVKMAPRLDLGRIFGLVMNR